MRTLFLSLMLTFIAGGALADPLVARVAADQAVLVHRLSKSACLVLSGAKPDAHQRDIATSAAQMKAGFEALDGHGTISDTRLIAAARSDGEVLWRSAQQIAAGDRHSVAVALLLRVGPLIEARLAAVQPAGPVLPTPNAQALSVLYRLRTQSQRAQRDLCLLRIGLVGHRAEMRLLRDRRTVPQAINVLRHGDPDRRVEAAPTVEIRVGLQRLDRKWQSLLPILKRAGTDADLTLEDVQVASVLADSLLADFNALIAAYSEPP